MALDIVRIQDGFDLGVALSAAPKAANVVSTQYGDLEYAQDFGVDMKYFLQEGLQFQTESYRAHLIERLVQHQVNVFSVTELKRLLDISMTFEVGDGQEQYTGGFIV